MKKTKTIITPAVPASTRVVEVDACDLCGNDTRRMEECSSCGRTVCDTMQHASGCLTLAEWDIGGCDMFVCRRCAELASKYQEKKEAAEDACEERIDQIRDEWKAESLKEPT